MDHLTRLYDALLASIDREDTNSGFLRENIPTLLTTIERANTKFSALSTLQQSQYTSDLRRLYLNEIWLSELPPPVGTNINTQQLVFFVEMNDYRSFVRELVATKGDYPANPDEWWAIMHNLWNTTTQLLFAIERPTELNVELLRQAHRLITENVLDAEDSGTYRTVEVNAAGSSVNYYPFRIISKAVDTLLQFVTEKELQIRQMSDKTRQLQAAMCLGGLFFSQLLIIHPFRDGNGRLARIVLSFFLQPYTVVPVSLYARGDRMIYMRALEDRGSGARPPFSVVNYLVECCLETATSGLAILSYES